MGSITGHDSILAYAAANYKHEHQNDHLEFHEQITSYYSVKVFKTFSFVS